jgi:acyl dehydratase
MTTTDTPTTVPAVGDRSEPRQFGPLTRTDFVKYQGASGDFHPLHHDETYAHAAGFPSVFSVGMLQAGFLATYATDWLGAHNIRRYTSASKNNAGPATSSPAPAPSPPSTPTTTTATASPSH